MTEETRQSAGRWLMWAALALAYIIVYIHRVAPSVVADQLMETFAIRDGAVLGSLAAMYFYVYAVMQLPSGLMADSLGPRATVTIGVLFAGLGSLLFAAAPTISMAFFGRFLVGLGVSIIFVSILKFHAVWFLPREFAFITGLLLLVGNFGAMLATTPLAFLVDATSWQFSFVAIGAFSLVIAVASWIIVRDVPPNVVVAAETRPLGVRLRENLVQMTMVIRNWRTWPLFLVAFGLYGTLITFQGMWGVPYLMQVYGMGRTASANLMLLVGAGMAVGSPLIGFFSDRLARRKAPYIFLAALGTLCWALLVFWNQGRPPVAALYPICFLFGVAGGGMTLTFTLGKEVNPPEFAGTAVAVVNIGGFLGIALMQPLLGFLLDLQWDGVLREGVKIYPQQAYFWAFSFGLAFMALAVIGALLAKETYGKNCYVEKK
ncbi:MFS transporter [Dethiobacter alkaliphilus]|uniref:MFS transporter n=1 Tax=Dethiobacter alkaliphilus TaxID=427926 RepID=UPI0022274D7C|nr:MFS transporter [Dethiobacter alkaliphilus]MCW3491199.1 MFS transporter [Dethiobacter alkaliphilus]